MEWVEITGKTIEEAVEGALDQLGVDETELDYEVLDEPKAGLFGRVRGEARIKARVKPATPRGKDERRRKPAKATASSAPASGPSASSGTPEPRPTRAPSQRVSKSVTPVRPAEARTPRPARSTEPRPPRTPGEPVALDAVAAAAASFLTGFFRAANLEVEITNRRIDDETLEVRVDGQGLGVLVGPKGTTLLALQELVRTHVHHATEGRSGRLMLDLAGYREKRRIALTAFTAQVAEAVLASGERRAMEPMSAVDRKVVHDAVHDIDGISSISEGEDPERRVILLPA